LEGFFKCCFFGGKLFEKNFPQTPSKTFHFFKKDNWLKKILKKSFQEKTFQVVLINL